MKKTVLAVALIALAATAGLALWPEDPVAARWQDYLARLERLTRQPVPPAAALELRPYPGNAALRRPLPDLRTGLLNYLGLRHCDLMALVSERNSALGKLRSASLRLDYELTFIERGQRCLNGEALEDPELIGLLERTLEVKRDSLGDLFWNATWASDELRGFLNQSPGPAGDSAQGLEALGGLASAGRALRESPPPDALRQVEGVPVAILVPLTGRFAAPGQALLEGAQMALFDVGNAEVRLMPFDTQSTALGAEQAAR